MISFKTVLPSSRVLIDGIPSLSIAEIEWLRKELYSTGEEEPLCSEIKCSGLESGNLILKYTVEKVFEGGQVPTKLKVDTKVKSVKIIF